VARSFREPDHLPNLRADGQPGPPEELPRQRRGTTPQMHGRYPDYDVLEHAGQWDEATRRVVLARLQPPPPLRFFSGPEALTLGALCDEVTAQDREPRIPVLAMVDAKLHAGQLDGFRYADMPEDPETWRLVARGLDEAAGAPFSALAPEVRGEFVARFADGKLTGGVWDTLPCSRAWKVVTRAILAAFYSHPWAWNEIGYGGPRYPRGYMRLGAGEREPDQAPEAFELDPVPDVSERLEHG
jgi:gluconate 2-dehydrogenase subunit 3-like protein